MSNPDRCTMLQGMPALQTSGLAGASRTQQAEMRCHRAPITRCHPSFCSTPLLGASKQL